MEVKIIGRKDNAAEEADLLLYLAFAGDEAATGLEIDLMPTMTAGGKVTFLYGARGSRHRALVGLGSQDRLDTEQLRRAAGCASRAIGREGYRSVAVALDASASRLTALGLNAKSIAESWVEGWLLGAYTFDKYKQNRRPSSIEKLSLVLGTEEATDWPHVIGRARLRAECASLARDWCNEPANVMTPERLVAQVETLFAGRTSVGIKIYRGAELERHGMNGLLAVGQGSRHSPSLVELTYAPDPSRPLLALVGKGMTFDMGGMNVKTGRDLSEARYDMGGACAVIGAFDYLVRSEADVNVAALIAVADNVPGAGALLPSSIIRYPNGLTVQVGNTDAEGRLILADALLHAQRLGAEEIIDIATLTGSVGHALGLRVAGVWGDKDSAELLRSLGQQCGERIWPMPLVDDDEELLHSEYADLNNISSSPYGGANAAALFLRRFVGRDIRWSHIDMANTVQAPADRGYEAAGATGFGVRLLADYAMQQSHNLHKGGSSHDS
ncbi:leucyl aminopeptidase family protein [Cohnella cholangitidis]|uniref:Probable cytosol aminopeptidase n=1 Tax=Cohnella cholangitidis TaxID=2598458 RepID=A0A7G5BY53_9BACL|nr:leucyl aminopeptidase family protein [Cohnella cholangitidis]QMV41887.1 leucyl aminopeptidase family protein [Cohnella cholangitidis]